MLAATANSAIKKCYLPVRICHREASAEASGVGEPPVCLKIGHIFNCHRVVFAVVY